MINDTITVGFFMGRISIKLVIRMSSPVGYYRGTFYPCLEEVLKAAVDFQSSRATKLSIIELCRAAEEMLIFNVCDLGATSLTNREISDIIEKSFLHIVSEIAKKEKENDQNNP